MFDSSAGSPTNPGGLRQYLLSTASWLSQFEAIWSLDFEFFEDENHHPVPVCMFAREWHTSTEIFLRREQLLALRQAPFDIGPRSLVVAYAANAEFSCFVALGWPFPHNVLDVYVEVGAAINGLDIEGLELKRPSLLETCALYGIPAMPAAQKTRMRDLILSGKGKYTEDEWAQTEGYNRADVDETDAVFGVIAPSIDLPRALLRGRYMGAVARMEWVGLPISRYLLDLLIENWEPLQLYYIARDDEFGLYDHTSIRLERLQDLINKRGWDWPLTSTGLPELKLKTLGRQAKRYPELKKLVRLREQIAELKISSLTNTVGADGFSRCPLLPFWTRSGRNQPSGRDKIFLPALPGWSARWDRATTWLCGRQVRLGRPRVWRDRSIQRRSCDARGLSQRRRALRFWQAGWVGATRCHESDTSRNPRQDLQADRAWPKLWNDRARNSCQDR